MGNSRKESNGSSGKEAIILIVVFFVVVGGLIGYLWLKQRRPSDIAGVRLTIYENGMNVTTALKNEVILKDGEQSLTEADNDDVQAVLDFQTMITNQQDTFTENEKTFVSAIANAMTAQASQAQMIALDEVFKADTTGQYDALGNIDDVSNIIDIYEQIWKAGINAVESKNIDTMKSYVESDEWGTQLEPYQNLINNISLALNSQYNTTDVPDDGLNQTTDGTGTTE